MHFKENAEVVTSELEKIGDLDRVVVDPATEEVTHLVVKKGFLFTKDRVILAGYVDITTPNKIVLKKDAPDPGEYPGFERTDYVPMGSYEDFKDQASRDARKLLWYHASVKLPGEQGRFYQSDSDKPLFYKEKRRNIPDDGVPLEEGAVVKDITGKDLGKIQDVFTEPEPFKVTHILMSSGTINKTSKLIPVDWIKEISEDFVQLYLRKETFENLAGADTVIKKQSSGVDSS